MNKQTGANRSAMTRKLKSIAVAAIVLILGLGTAVYAQGYGSQWFGMGSDNVLGMMPPGGMVPPPQHGAKQATTVPPCAARPNLKLTQSGAGRTVTYVSSKRGCIYTISRAGKAWLTVTYDALSKTYKLTDPNGTGALLLELGIAPGKFNPWVLPSGSNKNPN
jgi:hypothetical protein